jgi:hypothetical protein
MVSGASSLTYEEMVLVITMRVELEMMMTYFSERGTGELADVRALDEEIAGIARSQKGIYLSAQESARKNWGLPLRAKWLRNEGMH